MLKYDIIRHSVNYVTIYEKMIERGLNEKGRNNGFENKTNAERH